MAKKQVIKKNIPSLMIGLVVAGVLLGAMAVLVAQSFFTTRAQYRSHTIVGSDGLMGLVGEKAVLHKDSKIIYTVTYKNDSSEDRFITIKATQREKDPLDKDNCNGVVCDLGAYTGTTYSEKKHVKSGTSEVFHLPVVSFSDIPTRSVELEAFKTSQD